jgi:hypothetical protein
LTQIIRVILVVKINYEQNRKNGSKSVQDEVVYDEATSNGFSCRLKSDKNGSAGSISIRTLQVSE